MKLVEFSVTNYRSVTTAHKIELQSLTVLVGKNNEGKSNILSAVRVAMQAILRHSCSSGTSMPQQRIRSMTNYDWERDFPIQLQGRKNGLESIFRLNFRLEGDELAEFHSTTGIRGNKDIPISVKIGKNNRPKVEVPKRGSSSYNKKSSQITEFISKRISFNYIQAIRTEGMAIGALGEAIYGELDLLRNNPDYIQAQQRVNELQQEMLDQIASQLLEPLKSFIPSLQNISIQIKKDDYSYQYMSNEFDIIIDDGVATSISNKGDGIKSLIALAILKDRKVSGGASIIAIEEPESHLHSGAIHELVDVIHKIASNSQVIITTHNPLFVQQNNIASNIIVDGGTARPAKDIAEIRNILGVYTSDNLRNARYVLIVEGDDDAESLSKLLPFLNPQIKTALQSNILVIKSLGGASNLAHDLADLRHSMCKYIVLLDHDKAGLEAANKAIEKGLITDAELKYTICNGSPESEFEDCLKTSVYEELILNKFSVNINCKEFRGNAKWSDRMKKTFLSQGANWTDTVKKKVKLAVAQSIPKEINEVNDIVIPQKSGFLFSLASTVARMIEE